MRRKAATWVLLAALGGLGGCTSGPDSGSSSMAHNGRSYGPPTVPGVQGPFGQAVPMAAPYDMAPPASRFQAQMMMSQSVPLNMVQMSAGNGPNLGMGPAGVSMPQTVLPRGGVLSPPGVPYAPGVPAGPAVTPTSFMPNPMAGSGVVNANIPPGAMAAGAMIQAQHAQGGPSASMAASGVRFQSQRTQIRFTRPTGMKIAWFTQGADNKPAYSTTPIEAPGRYNFAQAAIYRLKLSNIEGRPGLEVYPTMEVVPGNPRTEAFLAHSAVPVEFTNEDFKQIAEGNYVVKVIYLPDPHFQDLAGSGTDEILSTRLEPGADPIQEALRRGSILLVIRMGNVDQEAPNTPALNAPGAHAPPMVMPPPSMPTFKGGFQVPYYGKPGAPMPPAGPHGVPGPGATGPGPIGPNAMVPGGTIPGPIAPPAGSAISAPRGPLSIPNVPSVPLPGTVPNFSKTTETSATTPSEVLPPASKLPAVPSSNVPVTTTPSLPAPPPSVLPGTPPPAVPSLPPADAVPKN